MITGSSEYILLHEWVKKCLGTPKRCEACKATGKKRYHWANISQEYKKDLTDWQRLCVSCHKRENNLGACKRGHPMSKSNIYQNPNKPGTKSCRVCQKEYHRDYRAMRQQGVVMPKTSQPKKVVEKKTTAQHGTLYMYKTFRCKCDDCRDANARYTMVYYKNRKTKAKIA